MFLSSEQQSFELRSNSGKLPGITYRTVDKVVQEDAFRLDTTGTAKTGVVFSSSFSEDLGFELEQNSALVITVKRDSSITAPVVVEMHCESIGDALGSCRAAVDITEQMQTIAQGQWQDIAINLQCFVKKGIAMDKVVSPFALYTQGAVKLSVSDIHFQPQAEINTPKTLLIQCP